MAQPETAQPVAATGQNLSKFSRRAVIFGLPLTLAACQDGLSGGLGGIYASVRDENFDVPAIDTSKFDSKFLRRRVRYSGRERPGTIIVDTDRRWLYFVLPGGYAMRYGIGVGKQGFAWGGRAVIRRKATWPRWTPTGNMIRRDPKLRKYAGGMKAGIGNPLGARALYLYRGGRDTHYRIHGTNEPWSIGKAVSSGCIRMLNQDVMDLYRRTKHGTRVIVRHRTRPVA